MSLERRPTRVAELRVVLTILGGVFLILWLLYGVPLQNLNWDPSFYYAHVRSPLIDGDLDFSNDGLPPQLVARHTRTGLAPSIWSAGPALVWAPFFLVAHAVTLAGRSIGLPLLPDGYGPFYLLFCALGSAFIGWLGVIWCYLIARRFSAVGPALLAAIGIWLTSPLFYYMYKNPLMAHAPTVALIGALVFLWLRIADDLDAPVCWFLLGLLIGLAAVIVPFALHTGQHGSHWLRGVFQRLGFAAIGALLGFLPQMVVWWRLYGTVLAVPQGAGFLQWSRPELYLLFGSNRGLFVWQPLLLVGCAGLFMFVKWRHRLGFALVLVVLLETYLNSIVGDWWGGGGFGPRRFDWFLPIAALGLAIALEALWIRRLVRVCAYVLLGCLFLYQLALAQSHYYRVLPEQQPFPTEEYDVGRPLGRAFYAQAFFGSLREPAFLVETKPNIWSGAVPPLHTWLRILHESARDMQDLATFITAALALGLTLVVGSSAMAIQRGSAISDMSARLARRMSVLLLAWVVAASVLFGSTGP